MRSDLPTGGVCWGVEVCLVTPLPNFPVSCREQSNQDFERGVLLGEEGYEWGGGWGPALRATPP